MQLAVVYPDGWQRTHGKLRQLCAPVLPGWLNVACAKGTLGEWHAAQSAPKWFAGAWWHEAQSVLVEGWLKAHPVPGF